MSITILSAQFSNADGTAIRAMTQESGSVLITQSPGKAEKWAALQAWIAKGGTVAPYVAQPAPARRDLTADVDRMKAALIAKGYISESDITLSQTDAQI
jgi:hypothetical protein